jgi:hypothetical protein
MKGALLTAAALLGAAEAGVHKMKLQKVPLSEQLVSHHNSSRGIQVRHKILMEMATGISPD